MAIFSFLLFLVYSKFANPLLAGFLVEKIWCIIWQFRFALKKYGEEVKKNEVETLGGKVEIELWFLIVF